MNDLVGWPVLGIIITTLIGAGLALMGTSPPERVAAKWCFHAAAIMLLLKTGIWLMNEQGRVGVRVVFTVLLFSLIGVLWFVAIRWMSEHPPNIICLSDSDLFVEVRRGLIRETEEENFLDFPRLVGVKYCNEATPPKKVGSISNVGAHIRFYDLDWPDQVEQRIDYCYWLDERSPYVSFDAGTVHRLVIGTFQPKKDGDGFERGFTLYENNPSGADASLTIYRHVMRFKVVVELIAGKQGEFGRKDEFELLFNQSGYEFYQLTEEFKRARREEIASTLARFIDEGERIIVKPIDTNSNPFYQDAHGWRNTVDTFLLERGGRQLSTRFSDRSDQKQHPYNNGSLFLNDLYTQLLNLKNIATEYSNPIVPISSFRRLCSRLSRAIKLRITAL